MTDKKLTDAGIGAITTPTDDDLMYIVDAPGTTPASKKVTWANIKATLKTYLDTLYVPLPAPSGRLSYNAATVTTANLDAASDNFYDCTIAGLTADRDFNLPDPAAAGEEVALRILDGDATYELIIKANGTEITRLFIAGEYLHLKSFGAGAGDWAIEVDGRKPCVGSMSRNAAQTIGTASTTKIAFDTQITDIGDIVDIDTNDRIDIRRSGNYDILGFIVFSVTDQKYVQARVHVDGTSILSATGWMSAGGASNIYVSNPIFSYPLTAGQYVELHTEHNYGSDRSTLTAAGTKPLLTVKEVL